MSYRSPWGTNSWWWPSPWWYDTPRPTPSPEPQPDPTPEPEPTVKEPIKIVTFAVLKETNEKANNTRMYDTTKVVLRRGNDFRVKFTLSRAYDKTTDALNVEFKRGNSPNFLMGSRFECLIDRRAVRDWEWKGYLADTSGSEVEAVVRIPIDAPIGEYQVVAEAVDLKTSRQDTTVAPQPAVILFNPWDKDDGVYLEDDRARQEYVLNGSGKIWAGSSDNSFTWPWEFEQFESYSLDSALYLLDRYRLDSQLRRSPVFVSRTCATMVNANGNDGGILFGKWPRDGDFSGGIPPSAWSGSGAILDQYWRTKRAVKWAQCWVFGGTLTSVLRALGIPARPITNFASAHDTDANRSIDFYLDANLNTIDRLTSDSIWNYHVWVEAWMERPDLRGAYGGWQAVDATPQEPSPDTPGNVFTLGPAPVSAIKEGQNYKYDSEFVISEVNADVKYYRYYYGSSPRLLSSRTSDVGKKISTKSILSTEREDITANYKHPEGSVAERVAVERTESKVAKSDVDVDIITAKDVMIGENLRAKVVFRSSASLSRGVKYTIQVRPVTYIGAQGEILKKITGDIAVGPNGVEEIPITVTPNEYLGKVSEQLLVDITVFASISETDTNIIEKETFRFRTPDLTLDVAGEVRVGKETSVTASFKNPLNLWLTNVEWFVEGAGLTKPLTINGWNVRPGGNASTTFSISLRNAVEPTRTLTVTFESKQLEGIMGTIEVEVKS